MEVLRALKIPGPWRVLPVASVVTILASATMAGDVIGDITEPDVVSPLRYSSDVQAFYLGLGAGYGSGGDDRFGLRTSTDVFAIGEQDVSGSYGEIRGGWRGVVPTSLGRDYVYGFEVGYNFGSLDDTVSTQIGSDTVRGGTEISNVLSVRLRNGLTNKSGRILYFVSVGYVWGDIETTSSISSEFASQSFEDSDRRGGFSASIGAEHKLNDNWSITGEYEYIRFDSRDVDLGSDFSTKSTPGYQGLKFGLNYTF